MYDKWYIYGTWYTHEIYVYYIIQDTEKILYQNKDIDIIT